MNTSKNQVTMTTWIGRGTLIALVICVGAFTQDACAESGPGLPVMDAQISSPPMVPPPITRTTPAKLIVNLEVIEKIGVMTDGVEYTYWTFGGTVPGSFIRTRVGDVVEFNLSNHPDNRMPHNIDLHAVTGPGGGATSSFTPPGHTSQFSFTTMNPGIFVYHCATAPVGMHIANGMYGLILVEPPGGLSRVDREYYIMQGDFYTAGAYGEPGLQPFDMNKALMEHPDYVVFNGSVGALVGDNAITAEAGETVRLYVGNGGPNLVSSFHVIGEIFDLVYPEGGFPPVNNVQTTLVPAGGATIVEFRVEVPGTFIIVDHSIFRTFNKGSLGMLKVTGNENLTVYTGREDDRIYLPEGGAAQTVPGVAPMAPKALTKADRITAGERIYNQVCFACHQATGLGIPNAFPPLAQSDFLLADPRDAAAGIIFGRQGEIVVNGKTYNGVMPALGMSDEEIASVITYVLNAWGNDGGELTPDDVKEVRASR